MSDKETIEYSEIKYLEALEFKLEKTTGGFVTMIMGQISYKIVSFYRCFPLSNENKYISVRDEKNDEIGIIKDIDKLPNNIKSLIMDDLEIRYFMPKIKSILKLKDELGYYYWNVETDSGIRNFTTKSGEEYLKLLHDKMVIIEDIDGNRYCILDYREVKGKFAKLLKSLI